jgi:hypothetical protein
VVQSAVSRQVLQKFIREEPAAFRVYSVLLLLLFIFNFAFVAYRLNLMYRFVLPESPGINQFLFFAAIILAATLMRLGANQALAIISGDHHFFSEYMLTSLCIVQAAGLVLFPLILLMHFTAFATNLFVAACIMLLAATVAIRWYRGMTVALLEQRIGILQIFSYFCGLEILPVLVLSKFIIETF